MRCLVTIKQVVDPYVHIRINSEHTRVETDNVKMAMNPFDEIAIEAAAQLKEQSKISEIIAVSIGNKSSQETLRQSLARGADKAVLISTEEKLNPLGIAKILAKLAKQYAVDLIIMGKQAIDDDCNQTGQMLAALLDWAQGTFVSEIDLQDRYVNVKREVDGGLETLQCNLPAVITTDLRLNEPRIISLPNVMQAKKKPLEIIQLSELEISIEQQVTQTKVTPPARRKPGIKVETVAELVDKLQNEAKVL